MSNYRNQYDTYTDNTYQSIPSNPGYNNDRHPSRNPIQRPSSYNQLSYNPSSTVFITKDIRPTSSQGRRSGLVKLNQFRTKVGEVIDLCKKENTEIKGQFGQVVGEEKQVYSMLLDNPSLLQRTMSYQDMPQNHQNLGQTIQFSPSQKYAESITPFQTQKQQYPSQSNYFVPQFSQVGAKQQIYSPPTITQSKAVRAQSGNLTQQDYVNYLNQPIITFGSNEPSVQNMQQSLNKIKSAQNFNLNEDALRLIEEIEKKAFEEIAKLRRQKLQLMQRLNQEIKNVNQEKKKNAQLSSLLSSYATQPQRADGSYTSGENAQFLQAQIQRLQSDLNRVNELNNSLRLELSNRGSGVPGIEELLRQGQAIRQQTLRLMKLKEQGDSSEKVQQLERKLAAQQSQKQSILNELNALKQGQGQSSKNRPFQQVETYQRSVKVSSPQYASKSVNQYEDLVSQMKRITGY